MQIGKGVWRCTKIGKGAGGIKIGKRIWGVYTDWEMGLGDMQVGKEVGVYVGWERGVYTGGERSWGVYADWEKSLGAYADWERS